MPDRQPSFGRGALLVAALLAAGAVAGLIASRLFSTGGLVRLLVGLVPKGQVFLQLLLAILLLYLLFSLIGAITGAVGGIGMAGAAGGKRWRYSLAGAYAFGVAQGLLLVPALLFFALTALYTNGIMGERARYTVWFTLFGSLYGLVTGLLLSLVTVRLRHVWRVILASLLGFGLGGALVGYGLRGVAIAQEVGDGTGIGAIGVLLYFLVFFAAGGAALGIAYASVARLRAHRGGVVEAPRSQILITAAVSFLLLVVLALATQTLIDFITVRPGSELEVLDLETQGVQWSARTNVPSLEWARPAESAAVAGRTGAGAVVVWAQEDGAAADVFLQEDGAGPAVNVSQSPDVASQAPVVAVDSQDRSHVVWVEGDGAAIRYAVCAGAVCSRPAALSDIADCAQPQAAALAAPAIAVDAGDRVMVTWQTGGAVLPVLTWPATAEPTAANGVCVSATTSGAATLPQLAAGASGEFALTFADGDAIYAARHPGKGWQKPEVVGSGLAASVFVDSAGIHMTWCDPAGKVQYRLMGSAPVTLDFPSCVGRPVIAGDADGHLHLVWQGLAVRNNFGVARPGNWLVESILTETGWSEAAIVASIGAVAQPQIAQSGDGSLHLAWEAADQEGSAVNVATLQPYRCSDEAPNPTAQVILDVVQAGGFYPEDFLPPYCRNGVVGFLFTPNPNPSYSPLPPTRDGAFNGVSGLAENVKYEVLFNTMQWETGIDPGPGSVFAAAVANLYHELKAHPENYPKGLTVRILLGNYPVIASLEWGAQVWDVLSDLRNAGVPVMEDPEIGWKLEVANYPGIMPHSHTKFVVVDGYQTMAAGFNYGYLHFSKDHPSERGGDLYDLGLTVQGPVSQQALATFDSKWDGANQVHCNDLASEDWRNTCTERQGVVTHVPEVLKFTPAAGNTAAFSLYRSPNYKEADVAIEQSLASAQESIDVIQAMFSADIICVANLIFDGVCTYERNALPWMRAMMTAIEQNDAKVRVLVENSNMNGLENRAAIRLFMDELEKRGLADNVQIRYFPFRLHAKAVLIDDELLIVGSQNFHYSAWVDIGLNEYSLATDDADAIAAYQAIFDYHWQQALPYDQVRWVTK